MQAQNSLLGAGLQTSEYFYGWGSLMETFKVRRCCCEDLWYCNL